MKSSVRMKAFVEKYCDKIFCLLYDSDDYFSISKKIFMISGFALEVRGRKYECYRRVVFVLSVLYVASICWELLFGATSSFSEIAHNLGLSAILSVGIMNMMNKVTQRKTLEKLESVKFYEINVSGKFFQEKCYFDVMNFVNEKSFEPTNEEFREIRQKNSKENIKFIASVQGLTYATGSAILIATIFNYKSFAFPQKMFFPIDFEQHFWAYIVVLIPTSCIFVIFANLIPNGTLLASSMVSAIGTEFKIVGICFERELDNLILLNPNKAEMEKNLIRFTKRHQELLE